jgi:hypothetical protein
MIQVYLLTISPFRRIFPVDHLAGRCEAISLISPDLPGGLPLCERFFRLDKNFS